MVQVRFLEDSDDGQVTVKISKVEAKLFYFT